MKNRFLEILKDAYPKGFDPQKHSGAMLQLWREEMAFALEAAAQQPLAPDAVCVCGNTAFYEDKVLGVVCTHCQAPRR